MSIFDWYNPNLKAGDPGSIKSNIGQMANFGANAGDWLKRAFSWNSKYGLGTSPETRQWNQEKAIGSSYDPVTGKISGATASVKPGQRIPLASSAPVAPVQQAITSAPAVTPPAVTAVNDFSSAFNGLTPAQQQTYAAANPNVDTSTGLPYYMGTAFQPGTPEYNKVLTSLSTPTKTTFSIPDNGSTFASSSFAPTTINDAMSVLKEKQNALVKGSDYIPSSDYLGSFMPNYGSTLQTYSDLTSRINAKKLAENQEIRKLLEDGSITREQAKLFVSETQRKYESDLANLVVAQGAAGQNLDVFTRMWGTFMKPDAIAPGSTLMTPTGQVVGTAMGASPQTVLQTATQLWQLAQSSGTATYNADGTPNLQPFLQQAQTYFGGGTGTLGYGNTSVMPLSSGQGAQNAGGLPPQLATYLNISGGQIINADKVPKAQQDTVKMLAAQNGVPYLETGDLDKFQSLQVTQSNMAVMTNILKNNLGTGLTGRLKGLTVNKVEEALQTNTELGSFKTWRDTAINTIQALAGGQGSGFRLNQAEIQTAVSNMPEVSDNIETAMAKMNILNYMFDNWKSMLLTGRTTATPFNLQGQTSQSGTNVIQTKVGAVDNSWF